MYLTNNEQKSASDEVGNVIDEWKSSMVKTHPLTLSNSCVMSNTGHSGKWRRFDVDQEEVHSVILEVLTPWSYCI